MVATTAVIRLKVPTDLPLSKPILPLAKDHKKPLEPLQSLSVHWTPPMGAGGAPAAVLVAALLERWPRSIISTSLRFQFARSCDFASAPWPTGGHRRGAPNEARRTDFSQELHGIGSKKNQDFLRTNSKRTTNTDRQPGTSLD